MIGGDHLNLEFHSDKRRSFRISVEGNIASGKSTILKMLGGYKDVEAIPVHVSSFYYGSKREFPTFQQDAVLVEPVDKWRNLSGGNLIGRMYEDAQRWGYLFQSYVLLTMTDLHHKQVDSKIIMLERSVYSARFCFVENLHNRGVLDDMEYSCYCQLFDHITQQNPPELDLIVYLRSSPDVCYQRLMQRGRAEEKPVTLEYLQSLHDLYENWLGNDKNHCWHRNTPVMVIDANEDCNLNPAFHTKYCSAIINRLEFLLASQ